MLGNYRKLLGSMRMLKERRIKLVTGTRKLEHKSDEAAIAAMVAQLDQLEAQYSPHKVTAVQPVNCPHCSLSKGGVLQGPGQEELPPGLPPRVGDRQEPLPDVQPDEVAYCPNPYPIVNWEDLARPNFKDRVGLPPPKHLPVLGCSPDPQFYLPTPNTFFLSRGEI